jgi:hypothetical protein
MKKHPVDGAHARARTLRQNLTEAEEAGLANTALPSNDGVPVPPLGTDRPLHCRFCVPYFVCEGGSVDRGNRRRPTRPLVAPGGRAERSGFLQNQGYRILRFWNNEVLANIDGVHETITEELGRLTPTQTLPHRGGGLQGENNVHSNYTEGAPPSAS